jgi:hypothetical protein
MIKEILVSSLNGFSSKDIPLFLFQLIVAALFGHIIQLLINRKFKSEIIVNGAILATLVTIISALVKYSVAFSILGAAAILFLLANKHDNLKSTIGTLSIVVLGIGCGIGSVIPTLIGFAFLFLVILFTPIRK